MSLFDKLKARFRSSETSKPVEPPQHAEEVSLPDDKDLLEKIALDVISPAEVRCKAINRLSCTESRETLEHCARNDDEPLNRAAALKRLSYPESRDVLCYAAQNDMSYYVQEEAVCLLPYPQEAELLKKIANREPSPLFTKYDSKVIKAAQQVLIKAGVCPCCGASGIVRETYTVSRDDDPDFEYETQAYLCPACNWHER